MKCRLFEKLLREDKSRFVDKAFAAALGDDWKEEYGNEADALKKFVNSSAVDKYNINWQQPASNLYSAILDAYDNYIASGGSLSQRAKAAKEDPKLLFERAPLEVVHSGEDTSDQDLVILDGLENDKFVFVCPLTWEACKWLDSFGCGGQGAKWCLGWSDGDDYWKEYTSDGNLFVMAFSKSEYAKPSGETNKLKFMVQLAPSSDTKDIQVWLQTDSKDETIRAAAAKRLLGHSMDELASTVVQAVGSDPNAYTEADDWGSNWGDKYGETMNVGGDLSYYEGVDNFEEIRLSKLFCEDVSALHVASNEFDKVKIVFDGDTSYGIEADDNGRLSIAASKSGYNGLSSLLKATGCKEVVIEGLQNVSVFLDGDIGETRDLSFTGCNVGSLIFTKSFLDKYKDVLTVKDADNASVASVYFENCSMNDAADYMSSKIMNAGNLRHSAEIRLWNDYELLKLAPWAMFAPRKRS